MIGAASASGIAAFSVGKVFWSNEVEIGAAIAAGVGVGIGAALEAVSEAVSGTAALSSGAPVTFILSSSRPTT